MKLSQETHQQIERFFRLYFNDESLKLPVIEIYVRSGASLVTKLLAVSGVTLGRNIYIKPALLGRDAKNRLLLSKNLTVHEITHVLQYQKLGFFRFLYRYFTAYFSNLRRKKKRDIQSRMEAYLEIPYEIEARDAAEKFVEWINRKEDFYSSSFKM